MLSAAPRPPENEQANETEEESLLVATPSSPQRKRPSMPVPRSNIPRTMEAISSYKIHESFSDLFNSSQGHDIDKWIESCTNFTWLAHETGNSDAKIITGDSTEPQSTTTIDAEAENRFDNLQHAPEIENIPDAVYRQLDYNPETDDDCVSSLDISN